jgi:AcrR family transcriptional regulator
LQSKLRAAVKDAIIDAAEEVAVEAGLGGLTIAAVAERAGVAVGTLYNHFDDREEIVAAVFRARRAALRPMIDAAARATVHLGFEARLREFVRRLLLAFEQHDRFIRLAVLADRDGCKLARDTTLMELMIRALEEIMAAGAKQRLFPATRVAIYARMLHGALRAMFVWRLTEGTSVCADGDLLVGSFLRGITA